MTSTHTPLANLDAERQVLAAALHAQNRPLEELEGLSPAQFYEPTHEAIYEAILALQDDGQPVDPLTVAAQLERMGKKHPNWNTPLIDLYTNFFYTGDTAYHAKIIKEKAALRKIQEAAIRLAQLPHNNMLPVGEVLDKAQQLIFDATKDEQTKPCTFIHDDYLGYLETLESADSDKKGIQSGLPELDEVTGGFKPGQMIIVAARPGIGKSTLAIDFLRQCAIVQRIPAAFFSLEMSKEEIFSKIISAQCLIPLNRVRNKTMNNEDWESLKNQHNIIANAPIVIDDTPENTVFAIKTKARKLAQSKESLGLIIIDYLQLLSSGQKVESRQIEVAEFSRQIKILAKHLQVPIIALSQLNRASEARANKRPAISDLRESGALEQDADMVILLHREDAYAPGELNGEANIILAKHRNGPTTEINAHFRGRYSTFLQ